MLNYRKKILVAVDGSAVSDKAVYEAVWMAGCSKGAFPNKVYAVFSKVVHSDDYLDMFPISPSMSLSSAARVRAGWSGAYWEVSPLKL